MTKLNIFWFGIVQGSLSVYGSTTVSQCCDHCLVLIRAAVTMETVTMKVTQPSTAGPVCPGQEVTLTCTVTQTGENVVLGWTLNISNSIVHILYQSDYLHLQSGPYAISGFNVYTELVNTTTSIAIVSNMTLKSAAFGNNNNRIFCNSPPHDTCQTETIHFYKHTCSRTSLI